MLFLLITLFGSVSLASTSSVDTPEVCNRLLGHSSITLVNREESLSKYSEAIKGVRNIEKNFLSGLVPPKYLNIKLATSDTNEFGFEIINSFNDTRSCIIQFPAPSTILSRSSSRAIAVHEYGHQLFYTNLGKYSSVLGNYSNQIDLYYQFRLRHKALFEEFESAYAAYEKIKPVREHNYYYDGLPTTYQEKNYRTINQALMKKMDVLQQRVNSLHAMLAKKMIAEKVSYPVPPEGLEEYSFPYQEVFADLVAVIDQNDPTILAQSFEQLSVSSLTKGRDFTVKISSQDIKNNTDEHNLLDSVRYFLWNGYFKNHSPQEQGQNLAIVYEVFVKDILEKSTNLEMQRESAAEFNERLMHRLELQLPTKVAHTDHG